MTQQYLPESDADPIPAWMLEHDPAFGGRNCHNNSRGEPPMTEQQTIERELDADDMKSKTWLLIIGLVIIGIGLLWHSTSDAQSLPLPTRETPYEAQCQDRDGNKLSDYESAEVAVVACLNNPDGVFVQGARYRVRTPPPVCPAKPADETQPGACPTGQTSSWTQTRGYDSVPAPTCWTPGAWQPAAPPAGACVAPCPPAPASTTRPGTCPAGQTSSWTQTSASVVGPPPSCTVTTSWAPAAAPTGGCTTPTPTDPPLPSGTGVLICASSPTNQPYRACASTAYGQPTGNQAVLYCPDVVAQDAARETCPTAYWYGWGGIQPWSVILTNTGWRARSALPATSTTPTVTATQSPNTTDPTRSNVTLTWTAVTNATGYEVERCTGVSCTNFTLLATVAVRAYANNDLPPGLTFRYRVRGVQGTTKRPYSSVVPITTPTAPTANRPPVIAGGPATSVTAGSAYDFTPAASDDDLDTLAFTIQNRPSWAAFSSTTGRLSGTPGAANIGSYANITITVSDGKASASLPAFAIAVVGANGSASLSWAPPTQNTDGSALTNLAGYRVSYGTAPGSMTQTLQLANASLSSYVVTGLSSGTWYFALRAYTTAGTESSQSAVASKVVP